MAIIKGTIPQIRELEECIRATKRYTEGLFTKKVNHSEQGDMPSNAFTRLLEVYLDSESLKLDWDMDALEFLAKGVEWFASRATIIKFWYDYRNNKAEISIGGNGLIDICTVVPNFAVLVNKIAPTRETIALTREAYAGREPRSGKMPTMPPGSNS